VVTIAGINFSSTPANNIVYFGAVRANVSAATATSLTVTVPAGATYQPITVTVNNLSAYSALPFMVTFSGAAPAYTQSSFEYAGRIDSVGSDTETTKYCYADIDGDGKIDIVTVDRLSNIMSVYRNITVGETVAFALPVNFATGKGARAVSVGDIDGDGNTDVVVTNLTDNTASVFRNRSTTGTISFEAKVDFTTAVQPSGISITDIDNDGRPDLVINTINTNGYISVLRNTTSGSIISFAPKMDLESTGGSIEEIVTADLDGDGKNDIIIPNYWLNTVSIFRNTSTNNNISFAAKKDIATGQYPDQVVIADLNGDGKQDIVVKYYLTSKDISVFRNLSTTGAISFAPAVNYYTENTARGIAVNDFDGDGKSDMAVAQSGTSVSLFKNISTISGDINFSAGENFNSLYSSTPIYAADFNGDGKPDISLEAGVFRVTIWRNRVSEPQITSFSPSKAGKGTTVAISGWNFSGATVVNFGDVPAASFSVVDETTINAVVGSGNSGMISVNTPKGTGKLDGFIFAPAPVIDSFTPGSAGSETIIIVKGKNFEEVSAVSFGGVPAAGFTVEDPETISATVGSGNSGNVTVVTPGGTAVKSGFIYYPSPVINSFSPASGGPGTLVTITGENFDGTTEVRFGAAPAVSFTVNSSTSITAFVGSGDTGGISVTTKGGTVVINGYTFIQPPIPAITSIIPASGPIGTTVTISGSNFDPQSGNNIVYFGGVRAAVTAASNNQLTVVVPIATTYGSISVLNTSTGRTAYSPQSFVVTFPMTATKFQWREVFETEGSPANDLMLGDIDGDGRLDIVNGASGTISVLRNTTVSRALSFQKTELPVQNYYTDIFISDIDGDGKLDIATAESDISFFRNTSTPGNISFDPKTELSAGSYLRGLCFSDFDNDGLVDFIVLGPLNSFALYRNTSTIGKISFSFTSQYIISGVSLLAATTSDIDGDGKPDIIATTSANKVSIFRNTGTIGNISFAEKVDMTTGNNPIAVCAGDLDNDGKADIAVSNTNDRSVSVFKNRSTPGNINLSVKKDYQGLFGSKHRNIIITDEDGDGKPDLLVSYFNDPLTLGGGIMFKNTSSNDTLSFFPVNYSDFISDGAAVGLVSGDMDMDGKPDVVISGLFSSNVSVLINDTLPKPVITSFSSEGGARDDYAFIYGNNFYGVTEVTFGGVAATSFEVGGGYIKAYIGSGASGDITVTTPAGTAVISGFTYVPTIPEITVFSPTVASPGTEVQIHGIGFSGVTAVTFGGVPAASFKGYGGKSISAVVGEGASGEVRVITPDGTAFMDGFTFYQIPVITSFTPTSGARGSAVTIKGNHFTDVTQVRFGGVEVFGFTVVDPATIIAIVGHGASGEVSVQTPGGIANLGDFIYYQSPVIESFSPATAKTGQTVTINGSNFSDVMAVNFGGTAAASYTVVSAHQIIAIIGSGASGDVSVTTAGGTHTLGGFTFEPTRPEPPSEAPDKLLISPNPAKESITVEHPSSAALSYIRLIDMSGRVMVTVSVTGPETKTQINTGNLPAGVYKIIWSDGKNAKNGTVMIF
jgi:hypothetical protein